MVYLIPEEGPACQIRKQSKERNRDSLYEVHRLGPIAFRSEGDRSHKGPNMGILGDECAKGEQLLHCSDPDDDDEMTTTAK